MSLLAQRNFAGGEIAPAVYSRTDLNKYSTGLRLCRNAMVQRHGGVTNRPGTLFIDEIDADKVRLIPFVVNSENSYVLVFTNLQIKIYQAGVLVQTLVSPYAQDHLSRIQFVQSADVMTLTHREYPVKEIKRTGTIGSYTFTIGNMSFTPATPAPSGFTFNTGPAGALTHDYVFGNIDPNNKEESLPSAALVGTYAAPTSTTPIKINIPASTSYPEVAVYKKENGRYGYLATVGAGSVYSDIGATVRTSDTPPENKNILNAVNDYPAVVGYFQQRLCFACSNKKNETVWMSRTGKFNNFSASSPIKSDDSITFTAAGKQINEVRHLIDAGSLVMFTSGGEWVAQGSDSAAITPTSINLKQTSYNGSSYIPPLAVNGNVLYMQGRGSVIRDLAYEMASDGYRGNDLTVYASHLFEGQTIVDWVFQQTPNSIIWAVRSDGIVLGLTYIKEHQIFGWHQHNFGGVVENIVSIPNSSEDEVYIVVKRTLPDDSVVRYLEKLTSRFNADQKNLIFMDSAKTFTNVAASATPQTLTGLDHLEGHDVSIFADGYVIANPNNPSYDTVTVVGGEITLKRTYKIIHVGLPYNSDIETLDIDSVNGSLMDKKMLINQASIFFEKTRGVFIGAKEPEGDNPIEGLREVKTRKSNEISTLTGVEPITIMSTWKSGGRMFIRQTDPLPMTILAITPGGLIPQVGG
ncbi:hypothetical protein ACES2L_06035 [Bdellovibrio bacteriovorus]